MRKKKTQCIRWKISAEFQRKLLISKDPENSRFKRGSFPSFLNLNYLNGSDATQGGSILEINLQLAKEVRGAWVTCYFKMTKEPLFLSPEILFCDYGKN